MPGRLKKHEYLWVGGATCLDFSNTKSFRPTSKPRDRLATFDDLLDWANFAGVVPTRQLRELRSTASNYPRIGTRTLERAKELRETIYEVCSRHSKKQNVRASDLKALSCAVEKTLQHRRLVKRNSGFHWQWQDTNNLERVLWPVVQSVSELVTSEQMTWVRECSLETCSALFLDSSKNKKRRWCDMRDCGNLAKARTHRARNRSKGADQ